MQTVDAETILDDTYHLIGWDSTQLETREEQIARSAFSMALQEVWESWWWEELMMGAQFTPNTLYSATATYAADALVYFPGTQLFYQAMQATTGNDPATIDPTDASGQSWLINYAFWARAQERPCAGDYSATPPSPYILGSQARSLVDGLIYQLYADAAFLIIADYWTTQRLFSYSQTYNGKAAFTSPLFQQPDGTYLPAASIYWTGTQYVLNIGSVGSGNLVSYTSQATLLTATSVWVAQPVYESFSQPPLVATDAFSSFTPPLLPLFWHALIPFVPCVVVPGDVRAIGLLDPRNHPGALAPFQKTLNGYRLPGWWKGVPWVWYRRATPIITGDDFDSTVAYTQAPNITFP